MWKKSDDFSRDELARLMSSPQAQALAQLLRQADPQTLSQAAAMAAQGNAQGAQEILSPLLQDPQIRNLIQDMEDNHG